MIIEKSENFDLNPKISHKFYFFFISVIISKSIIYKMLLLFEYCPSSLVWHITFLVVNFLAHEKTS